MSARAWFALVVGAALLALLIDLRDLVALLLDYRRIGRKP